MNIPLDKAVAETAKNILTKLPDGSAFFTATVMSKEEAMKLPLGDRPICYRISYEIYLAVWNAIGAASVLHETAPSDNTFVSNEASKIAVELCFKIANEIEKKNANLISALQTAVNSVECASIDPITKAELPWYRQAKAALAI